MESDIYFLTIAYSKLTKTAFGDCHYYIFRTFAQLFFPTFFLAPAPYPLRIRSDCSTVFCRRNIGDTTAQCRGRFGVTKFFFLN